jgi:hypothetical protein
VLGWSIGALKQLEGEQLLISYNDNISETSAKVVLPEEVYCREDLRMTDLNQ